MKRGLRGYIPVGAPFKGPVRIEYCYPVCIVQRPKVPPANSQRCVVFFFFVSFIYHVVYTYVYPRKLARKGEKTHGSWRDSRRSKERTSFERVTQWPRLLSRTIYVSSINLCCTLILLWGEILQAHAFRRLLSLNALFAPMHRRAAGFSLVYHFFIKLCGLSKWCIQIG